MLERANKTLICSVAYLDIVGYTSRPVPEQIRLKDRLNEIISAAISNIPPSDRVLLDTGDGAALCFLGDPEDALFAILGCRDILREKEETDPLNMNLRMGINLGPVKLVKDINGRPNLLGDGVNAGERVMSFAEPGQIMASRSYVDVVAHLSQEYGQLFQYHGLRKDKHVREHEVYEVCMSSAASPKLAQELLNRHSSASKRDTPVVDEESKAGEKSGPGNAIVHWQRNQKYIYASLSLLLLLVAGWLFLGNADQPATGPDATAVTDAGLSQPTVGGVAQTSGQGAGEMAKPVAAPQPEVEKTKSAKRTAAANAPTGSIALAISPWGEVYLDGKKKGVSPPLVTLQVAPGKHKIEIHNTDFPGYTETIEIKAQDTVKIRHKFD